MAKRFVDDYLLFELAILSHKFSEEFYLELKKAKVTPVRWRILLHLSKIEGMYISQLAEQCCYEQSRVTKSLDKLCDEGLAVRSFGATDGRRVMVSITRDGEALLKPLVKLAKKHERKVLAELPKLDQKRLKKILGTFVKNHVKNVDELGAKIKTKKTA